MRVTITVSGKVSLLEGTGITLEYTGPDDPIVEEFTVKVDSETWEKWKSEGVSAEEIRKFKE